MDRIPAGQYEPELSLASELLEEISSSSNHMSRNLPLHQNYVKRLGALQISWRPVNRSTRLSAGGLEEMLERMTADLDESPELKVCSLDYTCA